MKASNSLLVASLVSAFALIGCGKETNTESSDITAKDRIDTTAQVVADAAKAQPTQAQIDQYNKDESEMIDSSQKADAEIVGTGTFVSKDEKSVMATYMKNGTVKLNLPDGSTKVLHQAVSGSGARYASDGAEWWEHQGEATYSVNDKEVFAGKSKD